MKMNHECPKWPTYVFIRGHHTIHHQCKRRMNWVDRDPTDTARGPRQTPGDISIFDLECISGSLSVKLPRELHQITGYTRVYEAQILAVEKVRGKEE